MAKEIKREFTIGGARYIKRGDNYGFTIGRNVPIPITKHEYYRKKKECLKLRKEQVKHGEDIGA